MTIQADPITLVAIPCRELEIVWQRDGLKIRNAGLSIGEPQEKRKKERKKEIHS
jgi:hypothetical protein